MTTLSLVRTRAFDLWLKNLRDGRAQTAIAKRLETVAMTGHLGDWASVGDGVAELRFHISPGYRLYFTRRDEQIILLLCGGDKSSQSRDIARAKAMLNAME